MSVQGVWCVKRALRNLVKSLGVAGASRLTPSPGTPNRRRRRDYRRKITEKLFDSFAPQLEICPLLSPSTASSGCSLGSLLAILAISDPRQSQPLKHRCPQGLREGLQDPKPPAHPGTSRRSDTRGRRVAARDCGRSIAPSSSRPPRQDPWIGEQVGLDFRMGQPQQACGPYNVAGLRSTAETLTCRQHRRRVREADLGRSCREALR